MKAIHIYMLLHGDCQERDRLFPPAAKIGLHIIFLNEMNLLNILLQDVYRFGPYIIASPCSHFTQALSSSAFARFFFKKKEEKIIIIVIIIIKTRHGFSQRPQRVDLDLLYNIEWALYISLPSHQPNNPHP